MRAVTTFDRALRSTAIGPGTSAAAGGVMTGSDAEVVGPVAARAVVGLPPREEITKAGAAGGGVGAGGAAAEPRQGPKSLVQVEHAGGTACYRLLETIRQFADQQRRDAGEKAALLRAHRDWYVAFAVAGDPERAVGVVNDTPQAVEAEHDNLRAALSSGLSEDGGDAARGQPVAFLAGPRALLGRQPLAGGIPCGRAGADAVASPGAVGGGRHGGATRRLHRPSGRPAGRGGGDPCARSVTARRWRRPRTWPACWPGWWTTGGNARRPGRG